MIGERLSSKFKIAIPVVLLVIIADQISKNIAGRYLEVSCNVGFAFGLGIASWPILFFVLILVGYFLFKEKQRFLIFSLSLIIGGGIANLVDRLVIGCVRDFINIMVFPSFNLADSAITIGVFLIVNEFIFTKDKLKS